jgi:SsrA-binding protein
MAKKGKRKAAAGDVATNRQARHRYELVETFEAGIELVGTEVKSLRAGNVQISDAYAVIEDGEAWLRGLYIAPYPPALDNHDPERPRKLLLHRYEIERLIGRSQRKGLTLIPTRVYFKGPRAKLELALARGKERRDRRREIRDRDMQRDVERELRGRR